MKPVYTLSDLRNWREVTADCTPPLRLAVIGDPVAHSKSPQMHNPALVAAGIDAAYTRLHILPGEVEECLRLLPVAGFIGINCTSPHKGSVLAAVDSPDETARRAGGVNTVIVQPDGSTAGKYVTLSATYSHTPLFPSVIGAGARTLAHSATVMLK